MITGMHRSGTSFVTNLIYAIGGDLGAEENLINADQWNARGYFEDRSIVDLNNRLMIGNRLADLYWKVFYSKRSRKMRSVILALLNVSSLVCRVGTLMDRRGIYFKDRLCEVDHAMQNITVKDPRFSITLSIWRRYANVEKVLFCYRHPVAVAQSLRRRQLIPLCGGLWLWEWHLKSFIEQAAGLPTIMVNYDHFFSSDMAPIELRRIYNFLDKPFCAKQARRILTVVRDRDLRHFDTNTYPLPTSLAPWWQYLEGVHGRHEAARALMPAERAAHDQLHDL